MNIVNKLTLRQLQLNKKRTLVTIIGSIISVAMVTAVATLGISYLDLMRRQTIAEDGEWHILYKEVNQTQVEAIKNDGETKNLILEKSLGYAPIESQNQNKPYIYLMAYNEEGFNQFPIELMEGRFPQNENEIVISEPILSNAKVSYRIGDVITLDIGQRHYVDAELKEVMLDQNFALQRNSEGVEETFVKEFSKNYTIVGMIKRPEWEPAWSPGYTALSYVDEHVMTSKDMVNAYVILQHINDSIFDYGENFAEHNGIEAVSFNHSLLRYYGIIKDDELRLMLFKLSAIIIGIIMIGSVSLIYNAFAISVSERSRYLGMLSSVGATKKQKRDSVFFEGAVIGIISIPIGIIAGIAGLGITFICINPIIKSAMQLTEDFRVVVLPSSILITVIISALTIFISTYIPARRASNVSAIDAIRQVTDVKLTSKEVKTSKLTRKIFGIEGDLGLKNLKRNKRRYKATVFSLIISMVLFLVVSFFTSGLKKLVVITQHGINYDIQVTIQSENHEELENIINHINLLENITESTHIECFEAKTWVDEQYTADYLKEDPESKKENGKYLYTVYVNVLDDESLKAYAKEVGVNLDRLKDTTKPGAVIIDTAKYKNTEEDRYVESKMIKAREGLKLDLNYYDWSKEKDIPLESVEIIALTDKLPMGILPFRVYAGFNMIISKDVYDHFRNIAPLINQEAEHQLFLKSDNPLKLQEGVETIQNSAGPNYIDLINVFLIRQREEQTLLLMSVFTYAFILLITAICIANILNTVSTSIALRKREFAMLKSVGMTPKSFNKMIYYESIFYGLKALIYGLPISFAVMYLLHHTLMIKLSYRFSIPWDSVGIAISAVFIIVGMAMIYSSQKVKKENIIDVLKQDIV
ncbi:FtsX-like permease family protein [Defluviitalea raffinosedens]|uniref:FtsX-like permease family protein n=1 Tax=Defluviitalea raffinosedens TaxID=1450156 RepID=UPI0019576885|nr:FtsX-like permease family protein [Defluviitalea raffinosedens]MBM7685757.1 putative ABC transport system permease protein [Defluviitalea raffinosedens]